METEKKFIETASGRLAYSEAGSGDPVVFVHGLFASSATFRELRAAQPDGLRTIAVDLPGFGDSELLRGFSPSWTSFRDAVLAFLDSMELERCALVGHSMGGGISIMSAAHQPDRVDRLVLVDAVSLPFPLSFKAKLPTIPLLGAAAFHVYRRKMFRDYFRYDVFRDPAKVNLEKVDAHYTVFNRGRDHQRACIGVTTQPGAVAQATGQIQCPTLGIWGAEDRLIPPDIGRRLFSQLANGTLHLIPECGHSPFEEATTRAAPLLWKFLTD